MLGNTASPLCHKLLLHFLTFFQFSFTGPPLTLQGQTSLIDGARGSHWNTLRRMNEKNQYIRETSRIFVIHSEVTVWPLLVVFLYHRLWRNVEHALRGLSPG